MKVKNLGKRGWHNSVKRREKIVQVNQLNLDEKDWQVNLYIKKEKIANESVECRQHRLANQRQYEKEKNSIEFNWHEFAWFSYSKIAKAACAISAISKSHSCKLTPNSTRNSMITYTNFTPVVSLTHGEPYFCLRTKTLATTLSMKSYTCTHCGPIFVFVNYNLQGPTENRQGEWVPWISITIIIIITITIKLLIVVLVFFIKKITIIIIIIIII